MSRFLRLETAVIAAILLIVLEELFRLEIYGFVQFLTGMDDPAEVAIIVCRSLGWLVSVIIGFAIAKGRVELERAKRADRQLSSEISWPEASDPCGFVAIWIAGTIITAGLVLPVSLCLVLLVVGFFHVAWWLILAASVSVYIDLAVLAFVALAVMGGCRIRSNA